MTWLLLRAVLLVVVACTGQSSQLPSQYWRDSSLRNISLLFHRRFVLNLALTLRSQIQNKYPEAWQSPKERRLRDYQQDIDHQWTNNHIHC